MIKKQEAIVIACFVLLHFVWAYTYYIMQKVDNNAHT